MRISDWSSDVCSSDLSLYDGRTPQEILAIDIKDAIARLGFAQALSPNRANCLFSMVERIRALAAREAETLPPPLAGEGEARATGGRAAPPRLRCPDWTRLTSSSPTHLGCQAPTAKTHTQKM